MTGTLQDGAEQSVAGGLGLRAMTIADLPRVLAIEAVSFRSPWPLESFLYELQAPGAWNGVAVDAEGHVVGYLLCRLVVDVWHVLNVAVARGERGRGVARALMREFLAAASPSGYDVTLEVRPSNTVAIALYESLGFTERGRRRAYYDDTQEDALIMTLDMASWRTEQ